MDDVAEVVIEWTPHGAIREVFADTRSTVDELTRAWNRVADVSRVGPDDLQRVVEAFRKLDERK